MLLDVQSADLRNVQPVKMSLYVVSACNLACRECIMHGVMSDAPQYQMTIDEIDELILYAERNRYRFDFVLTGGEPLLWRYMLEGLAHLRGSPITSSITMFTNAGFPDRVTPAIARMLDSIRVSEYFYNKPQIEALQTMHGEKVQVVERTGFWENPSAPLPLVDVLPVECLNSEVLLYNHQVYACPHNLSIALSFGSQAELSVPVSHPNFLDELQRIKHAEAHQQQICSGCVSNACVRRLVSKTMNVSGNRISLPDIPPEQIAGYAASKELTIPAVLVPLTLPPVLE